MPFNTTASPDGNTITFPYTNLTTTEIAQMTQGIEDGKEKWGTNETFTDDTTITTNSADTVDDSSTTESTTSTTIEDTSIPTTTSTTTSEDSSTIESTTSISSTKLTTDHGILPIENPMVLDDRVLEDLKSSNFSEESIKNWLAKGLDKNAKTENGDTLLFEAAYQPSEDAVKYLLQIPGIDLSVKGYVDILQWAVSNGYSGIAKLILEAKLGKLDSKDETGNNLVHMTAKGGFVNVLDELAPYVDAQKLQEKNNDDKTPLEVAEENDHQPFVDALKKLINSSEK